MSTIPRFAYPGAYYRTHPRPVDLVADIAITFAYPSAAVAGLIYGGRKGPSLFSGAVNGVVTHRLS